MSAAVVQEFCSGGKVELFPDEDWPTQILAAEGELLPLKFTELQGWLGCWRWWWALARQLGGSVRAGEDGDGRYFVQFLPGRYRDCV